jgi:hypothetical protein
MIELLFIAQTFRNPIQTLVRRLVLPQPVPRLARRTPMQGLHGIVAGVVGCKLRIVTRRSFHERAPTSTVA